MFAGVVLLVDGILAIVKGIAGIASDDVYTRVSNYTFKFDITAWGWIHLVLGVGEVVEGGGRPRPAAPGGPPWGGWAPRRAGGVPPPPLDQPELIEWRGGDLETWR
nr:hypothetical protein [Streptomyces sp. QL37]